MQASIISGIIHENNHGDYRTMRGLTIGKYRDSNVEI